MEPMPSSFPVAVAVLLADEGGYAPKDAGKAGAVHFGITERWAINAGVAAPEDAGEYIRDLTRAEAEAVYRVYFWDHYGIGKLEDQRIATAMLSMIVNLGPGPAVKTLQRTLNQFGWPRLLVDGILGPVTVWQANRAVPEVLAAAWRGYIEEHYRGVASRPGYEKYLSGWLRRLAKLLPEKL